MEPTCNNSTPAFPVGLLSNGGEQRYSLEARSTTGVVAWQMADGTILTNEGIQALLPKSPSVSFWPCSGYKDTTPAGKITYFDCHRQALTHLDVRGLTGLEFLDCCSNRLTELPLDGLTELQALEVEDNRLTSLEVRHLRGLRELNCASNRLAELDCSGLDRLQILEYSGNRSLSPKLDGCTALQDGQKSVRPAQ